MHLTVTPSLRYALQRCHEVLPSDLVTPGLTILCFWWGFDKFEEYSNPDWSVSSICYMNDCFPLQMTCGDWCPLTHLADVHLFLEGHENEESILCVCSRALIR